MDEHAEQNFRDTTSTKPRLWKEEGIQLFLAAKITKAQQIERDADITHSKERHVKMNCLQKTMLHAPLSISEWGNTQLNKTELTLLINTL